VLVPFAEESPPPYERLTDSREGNRAYAAFCQYRDQPPSLRSARHLAKSLGRNASLILRWSAKYRWVSRAAAWDAEQDRVACQARLNAIKVANRRHVEVAHRLLDNADAAIPEAAKKLADSPHAVAEWVRTGAKVERDALGIAGPDQRAEHASDLAKPSQHKHDVSDDDIMRHLPPELVLKLGDFAIEVSIAKAKARREQRAATMRPVGQ
jgi:hypothetical protein